MKHPLQKIKLENKVFLSSLFLLSLPIVAQELMNALVNIVDSMMIGRLGVNSITAVGFGGELFFLYTVLLFGINSGCSIFVGQYWGKQEIHNIHKVMGISFVSNMVLACVFVSIALVVPEQFVSLYSATPEVVKLGAAYLRIIAFSYFCNAIIATVNISVRCIGQTKIPMITTIIALTINVALNAVFIFVLGWGVAGAAIATLIARVIEVLAQILIICKLQLPIVSKLRDYFTFSRAFFRNVYRSLTPVFLNEVAWVSGIASCNIAYRAVGNDAQAALRISATAQNLFMVFGFSIGTATSIMVANALGAGKLAKAKRYARRCLRLAIVAAVFMGGLLVVSAPLILSIYTVSDEIKTTAYYLICIIAVVMAIRTLNYTSIVGILRSGGDTKFCLWLELISVWGIAVPCAFLGAYVFHLPIHIIVCFVYLEEVFKAVVALWRVRTNVWARQLV